MLKFITESRDSFNVFVTPSGQYVAVREIGLAFGNTAKEMYLVDTISQARHFYSNVTKLKVDDYYHDYKLVLEYLINSLEVKTVISKTEYYFK